MTLQALLSELRARNITLWMDGDRLRYRTASGELPLDLRNQIKEKRQNIVDFLNLLQNIKNNDAQAALVAIQRNGTSTPIYFVPPAGGTGLSYRRLAANLGNQQPVYTFNLTDSVAGHGSYESIEDIAKRLVSEILEVQPQGPYLIGGMCLGGLVAWEMVQQLQRSQQKVACLIMLDSSVPWNSPEWSLDYKKPWLFKLLRKIALELAMHKFSWKSISSIARRGYRKINPSGNKQLQNYKESINQHISALSVYSATPVDVEVLMICTKEFSERANYFERWKMLIIRRFELIILSDVNHAELLLGSDDHIKKICGEISCFLKRNINAQ